MAQAGLAVWADESSGISCASLLWQQRGRLRATVQAAATFDLVADGRMQLVTTRRPFIELPIAAWLLKGDLTYRGHAYAHGSQPTKALTVRLALKRASGSTAIDKSVRIAESDVFDKRPMILERAS